MGEFFDLPRDKSCIHPEHTPPSGLYIPPGKGYRHICPGCGASAIVIPQQFFLSASPTTQVDPNDKPGWKTCSAISAQDR